MNVIIERNSSGTTTATYTRGLSYGGGIGGIIKGLSPQGTVPEVYYHYDGLGNVMHLTNSSGSVVKTYTYEAFGSIVAQAGSVANPYQFQTKYINPATGFSHFGFRFYNPAVGRFTTADPLGFVNGPNLYAYVGNSPVNLIDPLGLCEEGAWWRRLWDWTWYNLLEPAYNTLTQPGYNYGEWAFGEKNWRNFYGASLDAAWFISGAYGAVQAVAASGTPYWQYYPADNPAYKSPWMTRGGQPPHRTGGEAAKALQLPQPRNPGTAVRQVDVKWWERVAGPRRVGGGTGWEYFRDSFSFPKK